MTEYRRYQPRRPRAVAGTSRKWFIIILVVIGLVILGNFIWGGKKSISTNPKKTGNTNAGITLLTDKDQSAGNISVLNNSNTVINTNVTRTAPGAWNNFSTTSCPKAISNFGTAKRVVLTIGFSAANESVTKVLESLKQAGVPADFFVSGSFAIKNPEIVSQASQAGFAVYSQSYDSTNISTMSADELSTAITKSEKAIVAATGITPQPIFRPPAGSFTPATIKQLHLAGYCTVLWTVDAYDWQDGMTATGAQARVMAAVEKQTSGTIIALHAGYDITPQLITDLVAELKTKGYEIVSLFTLLTT